MTDLAADYETALAALPAKQRKFVVEYLRDLHQRNAAIRAGYSEKTADVQASQILRNLKVRAAVAAGMALHMPASEVLLRLSAIARGSLADFIDILPADDATPPADMGAAHDRGAGWRPNLAKAERAGQLWLLKKIKSGQWGPEVELHDHVAALTLIGKQHGLFKDQGMQLNIDLSQLTTDQLTRLAAGENPIDVLRRP